MIFSFFSLTPFSQLPPGPTRVSSTAGLTQLWGVNAITGTVYSYNTTTSTWDTVKGPSLQQIHVSVGAGGVNQVVGVDFTGSGWRYALLLIYSRTLSLSFFYILLRSQMNFSNF
jgi:hypothetical protein